VVSRCAIRRGGRSGGGSKDGCRVRARETVFGFRFQNGENNDGVRRMRLESGPRRMDRTVRISLRP